MRVWLARLGLGGIDDDGYALIQIMSYFSQTRHRYRTKVELKSSPAQSQILSGYEASTEEGRHS